MENKLTIALALFFGVILGNCAGDHLTYLNCAQKSEAQLMFIGDPAIKCEVIKNTDK